MTGLSLTRAEFLRGLGASAALTLAPGAWAREATRRRHVPALDHAQWQLGPFARVAVEPVIKPDPAAVFDDPMRKGQVNWMAAHAFNPASIVRDGRMVVLFRAEDRPGEKTIGFHTSRLGYAWSDDGERFSYRPAPVLFPGEDSQKSAEWDGGCEDPRLCEGPDGTYYVTYTQWNHKSVRLGIASSRDLIHWQKHGSAFTGTPYEQLATKSAAIVQ
jgi:beta-1,2-mannosidase